MTDQNIRRVSLTELRKMREAGELFHDPKAPDTENLGTEFWAKADVKSPAKPRSVHLKIDPEVFDFFFQEANGKGHLTKMQNVLRAYVNAHKHP
jgi:uncharacterized protein (DUF4415 family)